MKTSRLWIGLALLSLGVTSCKEDYFDQDEYNELVKKNFPVKNIDSNHTWATTGTATANISFGGDYGKEYKVGVYLENPVDAETVTVLYAGSIKGGGSICVPVTYPLYVNSVYVAVFDDKGHRIAQRANIENGALNVIVGSAASSTRAAESDYTETYARTLEDYLNPDVDMIKEALRKNNETAWKADQITVGAAVTLAAMQAYTPFTNADLLDFKANHNAKGTLSDVYREIVTPGHNEGTPGHNVYDDAGNWLYWDPGDEHWVDEVAQDVFFNHGDGKHYRVAAGTVVTEVFNINGAANVVNDAVIYVEGTLHLNGNTLNGPTIVVGNGGQVIIDGNTDISNCGRFVVYPTGSIVSGNNVSGVEFNVTNGAACYNSGVIDIDGTLNLNGSDFYNNNSVEVDVFTGTTKGGKCTNFGHITARTNAIAGSAYNQGLVNGCYMHFTGDAGIGGFVMLDNSRFDCDGQLLITGQVSNGSGQNNILYDKSMINAYSIYWNNGSAQGPTGNGEFSVVKAQKFLVSHANDLKTYNNVYFDVPKTAFYDYENNQLDITNENTSAYHIQGGVKSDGQRWCDAPITLWSTEASALISITSGDCTGVGYNDTEVPEEVPTPEEKPQSYRYCFEDNFPEIGDYDFNDAVVTVTPKVNGREVDLKVTIDAVGATEQLGLAFRINGVSRDAIVEDYFTQDAHFDEGIPSTSFEIIPGAEGLMEESDLTPGITDVVVKMTSNVHWAVGRTMATNGSVENYFYNTVDPKNTDYEAKRNDVTKPTVNYHFVCGSEEIANQFTAANIDVFIVEGYNGGYWEVHTVPYKTVEVIRKYASGNKSQYDNNFPWAICVPGDFRYPLEWHSIGFKEDGVITGAYQEPGHSFGEWAEDHTKATDWYLYPTADQVY